MGGRRRGTRRLRRTGHQPGPAQRLGEFGDLRGGGPRGGVADGDGIPLAGQPGQLIGQRGVSADTVIDLGDRRRAPGHLVIGCLQCTLGRGPLPRCTPGRGEVTPVLGVDPIDEQRFGTGQRGRVTGGDIQRAGQRVAARQIHRRCRRRLQNALGVPQVGIHRFGQHGADAVVRLIAGELLAPRRQHGQRRLALLVESLAIHESVRARADLGGDLGADIGMGGLDLLDILLRRAVLGFQQQIQRLDHRRLADLVRTADHHHAVVGELHLAVRDTAVVGQDQPVQLHAALVPGASRSSRASAP